MYLSTSSLKLKRPAVIRKIQTSFQVTPSPSLCTAVLLVNHSTATQLVPQYHAGRAVPSCTYTGKGLDGLHRRARVAICMPSSVSRTRRVSQSVADAWFVTCRFETLRPERYEASCFVRRGRIGGKVLLCNHSVQLTEERPQTTRLNPRKA